MIGKMFKLSVQHSHHFVTRASNASRNLGNMQTLVTRSALSTDNFHDAPRHGGEFCPSVVASLLLTCTGSIRAARAAI